MMFSQSECAAVIPCLDEAATIGPLVAALRHQVRNVFVVDDGSSDATGQIAEQAGAEVLRHAKTRGKGAALQTGWSVARACGFSWALALDGDGQHSPEDVRSFFQCAEQGTASLIVGNRMTQAQRMPWIRRLVNRWMSCQLSRLAGRDLPDTQCGFRLMNLDAWSKLEITTRHFEIESETLLSFLAAGFEVAFVPIRTIYKTERSKIHPVRDTLRWFDWWKRVRAQVSAGPGSSSVGPLLCPGLGLAKPPQPLTDKGQ